MIRQRLASGIRIDRHRLALVQARSRHQRLASRSGGCRAVSAAARQGKCDEDRDRRQPARGAEGCRERGGIHGVALLFARSRGVPSEGCRPLQTSQVSEAPPIRQARGAAPLPGPRLLYSVGDSTVRAPATFALAACLTKRSECSSWMVGAWPLPPESAENQLESSRTGASWLAGASSWFPRCLGASLRQGRGARRHV